MDQLLTPQVLFIFLIAVGGMFFLRDLGKLRAGRIEAKEASRYISREEWRRVTMVVKADGFYVPVKFNPYNYRDIERLATLEEPYDPLAEIARLARKAGDDFRSTAVNVGQLSDSDVTTVVAAAYDSGATLTELLQRLDALELHGDYPRIAEKRTGIEDAATEPQRRPAAS